MTDIQRYFWITAALLGIMFALTHSVLFSPATTVIGAEYSDIWAHIWGNWRTEHSLFQFGQLPYQEQHLNHPYGGALYHVDLLNSLLSIPLRLIFPPILAQNILIYIHWLLAGLSMILLARSLSLSWMSSFFAGIGYAFSPFVLAFPLASGVTERMHLLWLPLYTLCFLKLSQTKQPIWIAGASLCYAMAMLGSWHYGMFIFLMTIPLVGYHLWNKKHSIQTRAKELFLPYLGLAILCGLATIPLGKMATQSIQDNEAMIERSFTLFWDWNSRIEMLNDFGFLDLFTPFSSGLFVSQGYDLLNETIYIGFLLPVLSIIAVFSKRQYALFFTGSALFFVVLALGPELRLTTTSQAFYSPVFYATAAIIPFFLGLEVPWEYILPALFFLSLSAAIGVEHLRTTISFAHSSTIFTILLLIEWLFIGPAITPLPSSAVVVPEVYEQLAQKDGDFAVFDFPALRANSSLSPEVYLYYQSIHQHPIPYSIQESWLNTDPFWRQLMQFQQQPPDSLQAAFQQCTGRECINLQEIKTDLWEKGFHYFILHLNLIDPSQHLNHQSFWREYLGEPIQISPPIELYFLGESSPE